MPALTHQTRFFLLYSSEALEDELSSLIYSAKEDLSITSNTLRAMIRAFKQNQLYLTPTRGQNDLGKCVVTFLDSKKTSSMCICRKVHVRMTLFVLTSCGSINIILGPFWYNM